jgi:hypothetical protein
MAGGASACDDGCVSTFKYKLARRVHVAVHGPDSPSDAEWEAYLDDIRHWLGFVDAIFSYTVGGGPSSPQRDRAVQFWREQPKQPPIAVVTPSILVVRMAGALRWFMPSQIKAFTPRDLDRAFEYLHLAAAERGAVEATVRALADEQKLAGFDRDARLRG